MQAANDSSRGARRSELMTRAVSGSLLAATALAVAVAGGWVFIVFWIVACARLVFEWQRLVGHDGTSDELHAGPGFLVRAVCACSSVAAVGFATALDRHGLALLPLLLGVGVVFMVSRDGLRSWSAAGVVYAGLLAIAVITLRMSPEYGLVALLWLFAIVWSTDVGAYFVGRRFGGPKLWPQVSPKKTWSGFVGGLVAGSVMGAAMLAGLGIPVLPVHIGLMLVLSAAAQGGDLAESAIKRRFHAKDAGHLIPGHGGVMDRLDGFIAATFVAFIIGVSRAGIDDLGRGLLAW